MLNPHICIFDEVFAYPKLVLRDICALGFKDVVSTDGITYPGIAQPIPQWIQKQVICSLRNIFNEPLCINHMFARYTSPAIPAAPNKIHADTIMGEFAAHIYLSKDWPSDSGTSFWSHELFGDAHDAKTHTPDAVNAAANDHTQWQHKFTVPGKFNRMLLHDAKLWHCAEPVGGWGVGPASARLVLTTFFSRAK